MLVGVAFLPPSYPALRNIGILHYKKAKLSKHLQHSVTPRSVLSKQQNFSYSIKIYTEGYVIWFMQNSCKSDCSKSSTNSRIPHLHENKPKLHKWETALMIFPVQESSIHFTL